jgi:WD40 repeat protein
MQFRPSSSSRRPRVAIAFSVSRVLIPRFATALIVLVVSPAAAAAQQYDLYVANTEGSNVRKIAEGVAPGHAGNPNPLSWSPDGRQIVYQEAQFGRIRPGGIYTANLNGGQPRRIIDHRGGTFPAWSPVAGNLIAYNTPPSAGIALYNLDSNTSTPIAAGGPLPVWSPDGGQIAFLGGTAGTASQGLWIMGADGSGARPVLQSLFPVPIPHSFTAYGKIRFQLDPLRWEEIGPDGTGRVAVPTPAGARQVTWSRQGHLIAYVTPSGSQGDPPLYVGNALGGTGTKIANGIWPAFSPSALQIAFLRVKAQPAPPKPGPLIVTLLEGEVRYKTAGRREKRLRGTRKLERDVVLDVSRGKIRASAGRGVWSGTFWNGKFRASRTTPQAFFSRLHLNGRLAACEGKTKAALRRLSGATRGYVSIEAKAAIVNPTEKSRWTVIDRCDGSTLTTAHAGRVIARNRDRTPVPEVVLRNGRSYVSEG